MFRSSSTSAIVCLHGWCRLCGIRVAVLLRQIVAECGEPGSDAKTSKPGPGARAGPPACCAPAGRPRWPPRRRASPSPRWSRRPPRPDGSVLMLLSGAVAAHAPSCAPSRAARSWSSGRPRAEPADRAAPDADRHGRARARPGAQGALARAASLRRVLRRSRRLPALARPRRAGQFVGGFASASPPARADLMPEPPDASRRCSGRGRVSSPTATPTTPTHGPARARQRRRGGWRMVACDPDGLDLAPRGGGAPGRSWPAPAPRARTFASS